MSKQFCFDRKSSRDILRILAEESRERLPMVRKDKSKEDKESKTQICLIQSEIIGIRFRKIVKFLLSRVQLFVTWTAACQAFLSITNFQSLLKLVSLESVMSSNHLILCCTLLFLPSIFPSIRVISNESVLHIRWPKYWSFSFSISPSNEYSELISFRIGWFDLLAVQRTLKSLQHRSSKASILQHSALLSL